MLIRIATYNIHQCIGRDRKKDPERIAKVLTEINADIFALQEVSSEDRAKKNVLNDLTSAIGAEAVEGFTLKRKTENYGNAVLTRFSVLDVKRKNISVHGREPRGLLKVKMNIKQNEIDFFATHLGLTSSERKFQIKEILEETTKSTSAVQIIAGDFNEWFIWSKNLRRIKQNFAPIPAKASFPSFLPFICLDRISINPAEKLISIKKHSTKLSRIASDHLPLIAEVLI